MEWQPKFFPCLKRSNVCSRTEAVSTYYYVDDKNYDVQLSTGFLSTVVSNWLLFFLALSKVIFPSLFVTGAAVQVKAPTLTGVTTNVTEHKH